MNLDYRDGALHADGVALEAIAQRWGTPSYVYSRRTLEDNWRAYDEALAARPHHVCYAVKANDNLSLLSILNDLGSSFDIVSGGELERLQAVGVDPARVVFSGVGKTRAEIAQAVSAGVGCINLESADELARVAAAAANGTPVREEYTHRLRAMAKKLGASDVVDEALAPGDGSTR